MSLFKKIVVSPHIISYINKGKGIGIVDVRGYGKASARIENKTLILDSYERKYPIQVLLKDITFLKYHQGNFFYEPKIRIRTDRNEFLLSGYDNNDYELERFYNTLLLRDERDTEKPPLDSSSQNQIEIFPKNTNPNDLINFDNKKIKNIRITEKSINKIDINNASGESLQTIQLLNVVNIKKIIQLRKLGIVIKSFDDLKDKLNLDNTELEYIKKEITINKPMPENNTNSTHYNDVDDLIKDLNNKNEKIISDNLNQDVGDNLNKNIEEKIENKKIDLNNASLDELSGLPGMNLIKAKKIIQLRDQGNYITSYDDLGIKLNLTLKQIDQIKEVTIISEVDNSQNRVIDL